MSSPSAASALSPFGLLGSAALPALFLEARIHGDSADQLITQLGLSLSAQNVDVALFTRTSGVVLMASVGSYCAYRICARYLDKSFVWTLLDAARLDRFSHADSRLLHPAAEGYLRTLPSRNAHEERARRKLADLIRSLSEDLPDDQNSVIIESESPSEGAQRYRLISTRSGSPVRVVCSSNQLIKKALRGRSRKAGSPTECRGLEGIGKSRKQSTGFAVTTRRVLTDDDDDRMSIGGQSDLTSVSRMLPPPAAIRTNCCTDVDGDVFSDDEYGNDNDWSSRCSDPLMRSHDETMAEPSWVDEFAPSTSRNGNSSAENLLFGSPAPSDISAMSAVRNLEAMLAENNADNASLILQRVIVNGTDDDTESSCFAIENLADLIESKCSVQAASYMYHSVHFGDTSMDNISAVSGQSTRSDRLPKGAHSHGLWELTSRPTPEKQTAPPQPASSSSANHLMTDSILSRISTGSNKRSAMFDSAIGTELLSSEDDRSSIHGQTIAPKSHHTNIPNETLPRGVVRKSWLDKISEKPSPKHNRASSVVSSVAQSERSLEWFDECP